MSDFPNYPVLGRRNVIACDGLYGLGSDLRTILNSQPASAVWPTANRAIFIPFVLPSITLVTQLWTQNGGTATTNLDIGVFDTGGNKLISSGSTAMSGTNTLQVFNTTDTTLYPGLYYMGLATNGTTGTFFRYSAAVQLCRALGVLSQSTAFALPATATFAAAQDAYIPICGITTYTVL